jgi:hypothetical protein
MSGQAAPFLFQLLLVVAYARLLAVVVWRQIAVAARILLSAGVYVGLPRIRRPGHPGLLLAHNWAPSHRR